MKKQCLWCKEEFEATRNMKYCNKHKEAAKREKRRERDRRYYQKNKYKKIVEQKGTTSLGPHMKLIKPITYLGSNIPFTEFLHEYKVIKNNSSKRVGRISKGKQHRWYDNTNLEYGEPAPIGIMNTHNYATYQDYHTFSVTIQLRNRKPCTECTDNNQVRDLKRAETTCKHCGLVLENTSALMSWTAEDTSHAKGTKDLQDIAWQRYWEQAHYIDDKNNL